LFQNAIFSAFLLALTVSIGLWIPYNIGRIAFLLFANPGTAVKVPLRLLFGCATFIQDLVVSFLGFIVYCILAILARSASAGSTALQLSREACNRIIDDTVNNIMHITDSEMFALSAATHESLIYLRSFVLTILTNIYSTFIFIFAGDYRITHDSVVAVSSELYKNVTQTLLTVPSVLAKSDTWVISLGVAKRATPLNLELSVWGGTDRFWAILAGYTTLCVLGALYVRKGTPFSTSQIGREWEASIIDLLNQAGGVMKVILIISIEMLAFPLYCGLLLDAALLPLFEDATLMSRIHFTLKSPLTSIFVHWFVGTCYMFHFALFVSMCRKIMRKGVLCKFQNPVKRDI
jgi:E3 ubiquitin-protein ligase MARCH6